MPTPISYVHVQTNTGVKDIPVYSVADMPNAPYRINTPKGVGCFHLVDKNSSKVQIMTPGGVKGVFSNTIIARDNFNRANTTALGMTPVYYNEWEYYGTHTWGIQNNQMYPVSLPIVAGTIHADPVFIDAFELNVAYQVKIAVSHADQSLMWRIRMGGKNYFCIRGINVYEVRYDTGWAYPIATIGTALQTGDVVRIECNGYHHVIKVNGTTRVSFYSSAFVNPGTDTKYGVSANSLTQRYDDFSIEKLPVPNDIPTGKASVITEDFLDDNYNFTIHHHPLYKFTRFNGTSIDGKSGYVKSTNTRAFSQAGIFFEINVPKEAVASWMEIDYGVSSEAGFDYLEIQLDTVLKYSITGSLTGTYRMDVSPGKHMLAMMYYKNGEINVGSDAAYISGVRLYNNVLPTNVVSLEGSAQVVEETEDQRRINTVVSNASVNFELTLRPNTTYELQFSAFIETSPHITSAVRATIFYDGSSLGTIVSTTPATRNVRHKMVVTFTTPETASSAVLAFTQSGSGTGIMTWRLYKDDLRISEV